MLFAISIVRAKVFASYAGIALALGTIVIPIAYLTHMPGKVVAASGSIVGLSLVWLGCELLTKRA